MARIRLDRVQPVKRRSAHENTYYSRENVRLKEHQKQLNYIKRVGRRRMSKARRADLEKVRRQEIMGLRCPYRTQIAQASWKGYDVLVDQRMRVVESSRRTALRARLTLLRSHNVREEAHAIYARELECQIADAVAWTKEYLEDFKTDPFAQQSVDELFLHRQRRLVAGYHQELEFLQQEDGAYAAAAEDRVLILEGHRVHRVMFRKLYGW